MAAEVARALGRRPGAPVLRADLALRRLLAGNRRFRAGSPLHPRQGRGRVQEVLAGQHPIAMCLSCADSRVPPEILFDQGVGDLFVQRVAGNVVDETVLGSIEYGAEHLHLPALLVLGHSHCGAVAATVATVRTGEEPKGYIASIVGAIRPAVEPVLSGADPAAVAQVARDCELANVAAVMGQIRSRSRVIAELEAAGEVAVVGGYYDLGSGAVSLIG